MSKQRQRAPSSAASSRASEPSASTAVAQSNQEAQSDLSVSSGESGGWWESYVETPEHDAGRSKHPVRGPTPADAEGEDGVDAPELAPPEGIHRPKSVKKGAWGALLTKEPTLDLLSAPGPDASVAKTIPNGTPCQVVDAKAGYIQVELRLGGKAEKGWAPSGIFSDQPRLFMDEKNKKLQEDYTWTSVGEEQSTQDLKGTDVQQGYLGDCYFIAGMNAVGNANPDFLKESVIYDSSTGMYKVRFYVPKGFDRRTYQKTYEEIWVEVDGYLPTEGDSKSGAYARAGDDKSQWGAIMEKAWAVHSGGYTAMGDGGLGEETMEALTGNVSEYRETSQLTTKEVIPFFKKAKKEGLAIYTGSIGSMAFTKQTPLTGANGHYQGTVAQSHEWNELQPGTIHVTDVKGNVGAARDTGSPGDAEASLTGADVAGGTVDYKGNTLSIDYRKGKQPADAKDLEVTGEYEGVLDVAKMVIACHGYSFDKIVNGRQIQLYNPWGSSQPKPLTPTEYLRYYSTLSTVQVPQAKGKK